MDSCVGVVALAEHRSSSLRCVINRHTRSAGRQTARRAGPAAAVERARTPTHTQRAVDCRRRDHSVSVLTKSTTNKTQFKSTKSYTNTA